MPLPHRVRNRRQHAAARLTTRRTVGQRLCAHRLQHFEAAGALVADAAVGNVFVKRHWKTTNKERGTGPGENHSTVASRAASSPSSSKVGGAEICSPTRAPFAGTLADVLGRRYCQSSLPHWNFRAPR